MSDDLPALVLAGAGFRVVDPASDEPPQDHTADIFAALRRIGAPEDRLWEFGDRIASASDSAGPLDIYKSMRVSAQRIEGAIAAVERGLRELNEGLSVIAFARATVTPNSTARQARLDDVHAQLLTIVGRAVASAVRAGAEFDHKIDASIPTYGPSLDFSDRWRNTFGLAADRVAAVRKQYPRSAFRAQPKDHNSWLARLVAGLAEVYFDVTGLQATVASRNPSKPSPFPRFVREIWPYFNGVAGDPPKDAKIRALLPSPRT